MIRTKQEKTFGRGRFSPGNILFPALFCFVLSLFGSGCVTASVINDLGTTRTEYCDYRYRISSDSDEIVFTSKRTKQYNYLPLYGLLHHKPAWTSIRDVEERIPLDPTPEVLSRRCTLTVTSDPDAPPAEFLEPVSIPDSLTSDDGSVRRLIVAPEPVDILTWKGESMSRYADGIREFTAVPDRLPLSDGDTLRLRVRPRDMQYLAQPFRIRLSGTDGEADESLFDATTPAGSPLYVVQPDGIMLPFESVTGGWADSMIAGRIRSKPNGKEYLVFPADVDGGGLKNLTSGSVSDFTLRVRVSENLYPFRDKQTIEVMNEYRGSGGTPTVEAVCWKVLWFPAALAADVIALPFYLIVIPIDYIIWENNNGFR